MAQDRPQQRIGGTRNPGYMSQWMDRRVEGALGGSALAFFRVTVDFPDAVAVFERP
jgi:hypothetical protein